MSATITEKPGLSEVPDWSKKQRRIANQAISAPNSQALSFFKTRPNPLRLFEGIQEVIDIADSFLPKKRTLIVGSSSFSSWQSEGQKVEKYDPFSGCVQVFGALLNKWGLTLKEGALLLGYEDEKDVRDFLSGLKRLQTRDAKDRIRYLFKIHSILYGLFEDTLVERDWLRESNDYIDGRIPLDILKKGSMESLLFVKQFVEQISGH